MCADHPSKPNVFTCRIGLQLSSIKSAPLPCYCRLLGTSITCHTAHALRLRPPRFQPISKVSADGITFPTDPVQFKAEIARQAAELYGGRAGLEVDRASLGTGSPPNIWLSCLNS